MTVWKRIAALLGVLSLLTVWGCADDSNKSESGELSLEGSLVFACQGDGESQELAVTYGEGESLCLPLPVKLLYGGLNEGERAAVAHGCSAAAYEEISAIFIPASPYLAEDGVLRVSRDGWESWQDLEVPADEYDVSGSVLGFTSQEDIWLVLEGGLAANKAQLRLYQSADGGNSWEHRLIAGDTADLPVAGRQLDYAVFLSAEEGYISVGSGLRAGAPLLYRTGDGGESWTECRVDTDIMNDYFHIKDISYSGDMLIMEGSLLKGGRVAFKSEDGLVWRHR